MNRDEIIELKENTIRLSFKSAYFVHRVQRSVISLQCAKARQTLHSTWRTILFSVVPRAVCYTTLHQWTA